MEIIILSIFAQKDLRMDDETNARKGQKNFRHRRLFKKELSMGGELPENYICTDRIPCADQTTVWGVTGLLFILIWLLYLQLETDISEMDKCLKNSQLKNSFLLLKGESISVLKLYL